MIVFFKFIVLTSMTAGVTLFPTQTPHPATVNVPALVKAAHHDGALKNKDGTVTITPAPSSSHPKSHSPAWTSQIVSGRVTYATQGRISVLTGSGIRTFDITTATRVVHTYTGMQPLEEEHLASTSVHVGDSVTAVVRNNTATCIVDHGTNTTSGPYAPLNQQHPLVSTQISGTF